MRTVSRPAAGLFLCFGAGGSLSPATPCCCCFLRPAGLPATRVDGRGHWRPNTACKMAPGQNRKVPCQHRINTFYLPRLSFFSTLLSCPFFFFLSAFPPSCLITSCVAPRERSIDTSLLFLLSRVLFLLVLLFSSPLCSSLALFFILPSYLAPSVVLRGHQLDSGAVLSLTRRIRNVLSASPTRHI